MGKTEEILQGSPNLSCSVCMFLLGNKARSRQAKGSVLQKRSHCCSEQTLDSVSYCNRLRSSGTGLFSSLFSFVDGPCVPVPPSEGHPGADTTCCTSRSSGFPSAEECHFSQQRRCHVSASGENSRPGLGEVSESTHYLLSMPSGL